jgi:hypothetical protein
MDPVKVSANSDIIAKVRMKMIMITPASVVGTQETKDCAFFSSG